MSVKQSGFVLILSMSVIALCVVMTSIVINRVNAYRRMSRLAVDTQRARMLALSGIDIAMSQLRVFVSTKKSEEQKTTSEKKPEAQTGDSGSTGKKEDEKNDDTKETAEFLIKKLGRSQKFEPTESTDGFDGELIVRIDSEEGKINLNKLYDFEKKRFVSRNPVEQAGGQTAVFDEKKFFAFVSEKLRTVFKLSKEINIGALLGRFFETRGEPLDDVTQLVLIPEFAPFADKLFVDPEQDNAPALTDLFTVSTDTQVTPLLFSRTVQMLADLRQVDDKGEKKISADALAKIIGAGSITWQNVWSPTLSMFYAKEYGAIAPEMKSLFETRFEPTVFSVVSYGKTGSATYKIRAIIEKNNLDNNQQQPFLVTRLYRL